ncbi:hypothetical protein B9Z19DRAFT_368219 [Tuber borchii]|uniref:Uncharacterized protein n=1 Tax=Tuber borchii TaxID=42251 RepID=A0A2T6ZIC9_TUBBO|nr:hypothetical protein B9Z19DRAFT_368219 [Tuber borchii]
MEPAGSSRPSHNKKPMFGDFAEPIPHGKAPRVTGVYAPTNPVPIPIKEKLDENLNIRGGLERIDYAGRQQGKIGSKVGKGPRAGLTAMTRMEGFAEILHEEVEKRRLVPDDIVHWGKAVDELIEGPDKRHVRTGTPCKMFNWTEFFALDIVAQITADQSAGFCLAGKDADNTAYGVRVILRVIGVLVQLLWVLSVT